MPKTIPSRPVTALVVAASLALVPAAAQARPSGTARDHRAALSLPQQTSLVFGNLWQTLTRVWGKSGMTIDPSGQPAPPAGGTGQAPSDTGMTIDPDGLLLGGSDGSSGH